MFPYLILAQAQAQAPTAPAADGPAGLFSQGPALLLMLGAWIAIIYFIGIRPGRKQAAKRKSMLEALKKNDKVVTSAGIIGVVTLVKDDEVVLRVDEATGTKLRFTRDAIVGVLDESGKSESRQDDKVTAS